MHISLFSGDSCRGRNDGLGVCRLIYECAPAIRDLKAGLGKALCKPTEIDYSDVVCCVDTPVSINPSAAFPRNSSTLTTVTNTRFSEKSEYKVFSWGYY